MSTPYVYHEIAVQLTHLSDTVHIRVKVHKMDLWNDLSFSLCAVLSVCHMVATSDDREKSEMEVSADLVCRH